jgi:NADPH:quinone reductase-like Zn-dependent oxidoreductase
MVASSCHWVHHEGESDECFAARQEKCRHGVGARNCYDLELLSELIPTGGVRPHIDRRYPFTDMAAAIAYLEQGHATGKVVVGVA